MDSLDPFGDVSKTTHLMIALLSLGATSSLALFVNNEFKIAR